MSYPCECTPELEHASKSGGRPPGRTSLETGYPVVDSMDALDKVVQEREDALRLLQTGQERARPGAWRRDIFGRIIWHKFKQWVIPWHLNKRYNRKRFFAMPYVDHFLRNLLNLSFSMKNLAALGVAQLLKEEHRMICLRKEGGTGKRKGELKQKSNCRVMLSGDCGQWADLGATRDAAELRQGALSFSPAVRQEKVMEVVDIWATIVDVEI
ncbi:PREDICTED: uncharacterized protein LOC105508189 [Colobus angolensis palliatus]|uniref:uncharacterized protein LOC105508189 n=1 Tax=Colobus angolensis palliatus TaxID=336983 RepID=UPI0005F427EF|nr:PREDICTED: uncharacterized protein LOC105508189 [Colobus angolensis palliatus]